jgi:pseudaminic acid synthase
MKKFVIAEISGNHCKSKKILKEIIIGCSNVGADAVKMQYYKAGSLVNKFNNEKYKTGIWKGKTPYKILKKSETGIGLIKYGFELAKKKNLEFLCSVFEPKDFSKLRKIGIKNFKIASLEANYINLIKEIKNKNNFFISLGALGLDGFKKYKKYFNLKKNIFFYCKIKYPSQIIDYDLKQIAKLKKYSKNIGISDHTKSLKMGNYAKQFGANYFEKHVKLNNKIKSEDAKFSITVKELKKYICYINQKNMIYKYDKKKKNIKNEIFKTRKIFVIKDIKKHSIIKKKHLGFFRSLQGIETIDADKILGKKTIKEIKKNTKINFNHLTI